jgi:hypothetical protein
MRRLLTFAMIPALAVLLAGPAASVEKKPKAPSGNTEPAKKPVAPPKKQDSTSSKKLTKPAQTKKYDDFIDKNNNGIDDRLEDLKKKPDK